MTTHTDLAAQSLEWAEHLERMNLGSIDRLIAKHLRACAAALESTERLAGGGELLEFLTMTEAQVDDELRRLGIDPVLAIEMGANAVARTLISYTCRLCGHSTPHTHTAEEILIFRNGMKAARAIKPQAERVPLSDEQILEVAKDPQQAPCNPWWLKDEVVLNDIRAAAISFARAIERAHGITPQEDGNADQA